MRLMELNNVKVEWRHVLEPEIEYNEKKHPDLPVREMYRWVISDLDNNRIRSRVIMSLNKVIAYSFLYSATGFSDRNFASFGFMDPVTANRERSFLLIDWAISECRKDRKKLIFNEPFNAGDDFRSCMEERGIRMLHRVEMSIDPKKLKDLKKQMPDSYSTVPINSVDPGSFADALSLAFGKEDESVLIADDPAEGRKMLLDTLSGKSFGKPIFEASSAITHNGKIVAGIMVVLNNNNPLISNFFVIPDDQGKGIGSYILQKSLNSLSNYPQVSLWTDRRSIAHDFYLNRQFQDTGRSEVLYYLRPGRQQEQQGRTGP
jgi:GNAT superfamily N-acetyltransferase